MKKTSCLLLGILLVLSTLLAACGGGGASPEGAVSSGDSTTAPPANTAPTPTGLSGELVYWSMWNETEPQAEVIKDAIAAFVDANPDVKINVQWNGREIRKTLKPALDAGTTVDLWDEDTERVVKSWQEYALPLDDYMAKDYPSTVGKAYKDTVIGSLLDLAAGYSTDGKIYAAPYQPTVLSLMYNREIFAEAGIESAPTTWAELDEACAKLKAAGMTPLTIDDFFMDLPFGYHLARSKGVDWVKELVNDKSGVMWDDPVVIAAAKAYEDFAAKGYFSTNVPSNKYPAAQQEVATGKVAIYLINGMWLPLELLPVTGPEFQWGSFAYPAVEGGVDGVYNNVYSAEAFQIHKDCANPDTAFAFVAFMTTGYWDQQRSERTMNAPVDQSTPWPSALADNKILFDNMESCYPWSCGLGENSEVLPVVTSDFTKLISGQMSAEDFVANCKQAAMAS